MLALAIAVWKATKPVTGAESWIEYLRRQNARSDTDRDDIQRQILAGVSVSEGETWSFELVQENLMYRTHFEKDLDRADELMQRSIASATWSRA